MGAGLPAVIPRKNSWPPFPSLEIKVLIRNKAAMFLLYNKSDIDQAFSVEVAGY